MRTMREVVVQALARKPQNRRDGVDWISGDLSDRDALAHHVKRGDDEKQKQSNNSNDQQMKPPAS